MLQSDYVVLPIFFYIKLNVIISLDSFQWIQIKLNARCGDQLLMNK